MIMVHTKFVLCACRVEVIVFLSETSRKFEPGRNDTCYCLFALRARCSYGLVRVLCHHDGVLILIVVELTVSIGGGRRQQVGGSRLECTH